MGIAQTDIYNAFDLALGDSLAGVPVYKMVPDDHAPPFVRWGMMDSVDARTKTHAGSRTIITIDAWTKKRGFRQLNTIMANIAAALSGTLSINGHTTRLRQFGSIQTREEAQMRDGTEIYQRGTLEYVLELREDW